jgi:hypothetical protein
MPGSGILMPLFPRGFPATAFRRLLSLSTLASIQRPTLATASPVRRTLRAHVVQKRKNHSFNPVVHRSIGGNAQSVLAVSSILYGRFRRLQIVNHLQHPALQVIYVRFHSDVTDRSAHIRRCNSKQVLYLRRHPPDAEARIQHDDRNAHTGEQILKIIIDLSQFSVAVLHLFVNSIQFLVG